MAFDVGEKVMLRAKPDEIGMVTTMPDGTEDQYDVEGIGIRWEEELAFAPLVGAEWIGHEVRWECDGDSAISRVVAWFEDPDGGERLVVKCIGQPAAPRPWRFYAVIIPEWVLERVT